MAHLLDENIRLQSISHYDILDTPDKASFDRITRLAANLLQVPIALITLVDHQRIWLKSCFGLSVREIPREISFCSHAVQGTTAFLVPDTLEDPRFSSNPLVVGDPNIRFYLGIPLRLNNGKGLGTLCTLDTRPRQPTEAQVAMLGDLACMVVDEIELRQLANTDSLTGALTRRGLEQRLQAELERSHRYGRKLSLLAIDLDHFKQVNDRFGHAAGDLMLRAVVQACRETLRITDVIGRFGGEEFIVLLPETAAAEAAIVAERLRETIAGLRVPYGADRLAVTASFGLTTLLNSDRAALEPLARADAALYAAKALGRNRVVEAEIAA